MEINLNEIKKLLDSDVTGYRIMKETKLTQQMYDRYKHGKSKVKDMTVRTAIELQKYINRDN